ncbi:MAG: hypothetical protein QG652_850 [Pseudomonadota bacterium]|nr:hypothetical protein [Pseudomonadota bacterium]
MMTAVQLPAYLRQGNIQEDEILLTLDTLQQALCDCASNALRNVRICTPDLEADIYDHQPFADALLGFVRGNRNARIQILLRDSSRAIKQGHRLIRLAQNISSSMEIRKTPAAEKFLDDSFLIADMSRFVYRSPGQHAGVCNKNCKHRAHKLLDMFIPVWDMAEPDIDTRRLSL